MKLKRTRILMGIGALATVQALHAQDSQDEYHWLSEMNKAANVVLLENRVIDTATAHKNAEAIAKLDAEMLKPGAKRSGAYELVNQSPLGAGAVATSSFPLNRQRLAELLGFAGPIENSLFANELSIINAGAKVVSATTSAALIVGTLASDIELQYARTYPWFTVRDGQGLTGRSSSRPHKVNPTIVNDIRQEASVLIGTGMTYTLRSHNVQHGMPDSKRAEPNVALAQYGKMMDDVVRLFTNLDLDEAAARSEVEIEYSATPELADTLQRDYKVPFRVGHHFSSAVVEYGKAHRLPPSQFPYEAARRLYADIAQEAHVTPARLPLGDAQFHKAISSANMVATAVGLGGPQPAEVDRMIAASSRRIESDTQWIAQQRGALSAASRQLRVAFQKTQQ